MSNENDIVIVSALRTPFGRYCGSLKEMDYFDLGAIPMREVLNRVNLDPSVVDEVFWGVGDTSVCKDVFTPVAARQTLLKAGLPPETPSISLDKACVSAMSAVKLGCMAMKLGEIDVAIGGGATSFSQEPLIVRNLRYQGFRMGNVNMEDPLLALGYKDYNPVSVDSDDVAYSHGIEREEMDEWALRSHQNYGAAYDAGKFKEEIFPIEVKISRQDPFTMEKDEQYRENMSMEMLGRLKPIYGSKGITAGNAPGLNDGATAILFMTRKKADELGLEPLASIVSMTSIATKPNNLPEGPAFAMQKALELAGLGLDDIDVMEVNEAFAAVTLVSTYLLGDKDKAKVEAIRKKTNINGSAIAIGHPNTSSGARVMMNLMYELRRRGGGYAMGSICGGLAQADAAIIKVE
ncbi:MAG: thiolase family protein [Desulfobacterales bacterium]|nr:thiolase family protein [Desulfobacteraceae bacterium]MBT7084842.1 thiolase family protein [Desulfobacterales bacterium]MBT7698241.1 thiolase family protein [Desulfobacterales bacterium]